MKVEEFKKLIVSEFGDDLEHATPANVREFLDRMETEVLPQKLSNRIAINEPCNSYEEVIKDFFAKTLELPPEEAMVALWALALDLAFSAIESQFSERFASLFQDTE